MHFYYLSIDFEVKIIFISVLGQFVFIFGE